MLNILSTTALRLPLCALPLVLSWNVATAPAESRWASTLRSCQANRRHPYMRKRKAP
jgi:hypothetical protein